MWRTIRTATLLIVLLGVALHSWLDRVTTRSWKETLWVGVFPINADGSPGARQYIAGLTPGEFEGIENFFEREAHRFSLRLEHPIHVELYPEVTQRPPPLDRDAGPLSVAWWSLRMRWYAAHTPKAPGHATPLIRIFVMYHDPSTLQAPNGPAVPDSRGLQKGLVGVVHAFAERNAAGGNNIVIAHELLHTLGATDKYELGTGVPLYPIGFADPDLRPLYPQTRAEIMAGRRAVSAQEVEMPRSLRDVVVGPATATEILWIRK